MHVAKIELKKDSRMKTLAMCLKKDLANILGIKHGKETDVKARYTFVYRATPNGCELITHHSSEWPE